MSRAVLQITELQKKSEKGECGGRGRELKESNECVSNKGWHECVCVCKRGCQGSELCVIVLRAFFTSTSGAERGGRERKKYK